MTFTFTQEEGKTCAIHACSESQVGLTLKKQGSFWRVVLGLKVLVQVQLLKYEDRCKSTILTTPSFPLTSIWHKYVKNHWCRGLPCLACPMFNQHLAPQVFSLYDFSTNYCNLHNLYCGSQACGLPAFCLWAIDIVKAASNLLRVGTLKKEHWWLKQFEAGELREEVFCNNWIPRKFILKPS